MKIAFVSGNQEKMPNAVTPLGLLYVIASTPDHHEKQMIDLCFESNPGTVLRERLAASEPDLVAISMRNIQNNDYADVSDNLDYYEDLIKQVRFSTAAPIVLGLGSISSLHYWNGDTLVVNPRRDGFIDLSKLPSPDRTLLHAGYFDEFGELTVDVILPTHAGERWVREGAQMSVM